MAIKSINFNSQECYAPIGFLINRSTKYEKRHLERTDDGGVNVIVDGISDFDKEIQSELKNAGLQNILKLQELRYGTIANAIARASDKGVYADVSKLPTDVAGQVNFVAKARESINKLKAELGLSDDDLRNLTEDKLVSLYKAKYEAKTSPSSEGGTE